MSKTKHELRKEIASLKKECDKSIMAEQSERLFCQLEQSPLFRHAKTILLYHSLPDEVHTHSFIEKWYKKKTIILPTVKGNELELRIYQGKDSLRKGSYNIEEPTGELFTDYDQIDLAIIPGVAFTIDGTRLGRGKGYYDRLLPKLKCTKFGICFTFQLLDEIPCEEHDIKMDFLIKG